MTEFATIASFYDLMTGFSHRLVNDFGPIKYLVEKFNISNALDAGCGTGVHTIILAKLGIDVLGFDGSKEMLEIARTNALREGMRPQFVHEYFETIPEEWWGEYEAIFCLANSLVGVENAQRLSLAVKSFYRALKPGGRAVIQLLNMTGFLETGRRIIKVSSAENFTFVRFLDFGEDETRLNVIAIEHEMGEVKHQFISSRILLIDADIIRLAARTAGFTNIELHADLALAEPFSPESQNLVVLLSK